MREPIAARPFTDAIPKRRQQADEERNAAYDLAAAKARRLWRRARPANDSHAFLVSRSIGRHEVRQFRDVLIVPVVNANEDLVSLHLIAAEGTQRFLKGSRVAGGFYVLGGDAVTPSAIIITEGFAAAASIHEATGLSVVVAFLRDNLAAVTEVWRQKRPDARIVIAATDDWCAETPGNTLGIAKATAAAAAFGAVVAIPDFAATERQRCDTDFNGLARLQGLAEVKRQIETAVEQSAPRLRKSGPYEATAHGLFWTKETRDGNERQRLANFCAWIVGERIEDDGAERHSLLDIEAEIHGRTARFAVPASSFQTMGWAVEHIGADAVIEPGFGARDRTRAAIQYLSGHVHRHHTYAHTGWRNLDGHGWCYLHTGGAIGPRGALADVDVAMPGALALYRMPATWTEEQAAAGVRASFGFLDIAPDRVTVPLLGAVYRAAFGGADFSLHLSGFTGSGKSELAALAQQHFGAEMTSRRLPGAWSSTANQLEGLAFATKDAVLVIDDFVPGGSTLDRARLHQAADRVLRGVGNASGRGRAGPDGKPRPARPPRALVISTGEEVPGGQSLRARTLIIELAKGDIGGGDLRTLSSHQMAASAGLYAVAMAGFIHWLAADFVGKRREFDTEAKAQRQELVATAGHARTADIGAQLITAWRFITRFAVECRAISEVEAAAYLRRADAALALIASEQADIQSTCDPIERFRALLNGAVASGRAHIAGVTGGEPASPSIMGWRKIGMDWQPQGRCIGWEDGAGGLYLEPEASFAAVQEMGAPSGESIGIGSATLRKRLHERGLLLSVEDENGKTHLAVRRTIGGRRRRVLHIANLLAIPEIGGPSGPAGPRGDKHEKNQSAFANNGAKNGGPVEIASGPNGPQVGMRGDGQNGMAHPKWATGEKWATDGE